MKRIALVTGASSRLGQRIINKLSTSDYRVYAGTRELNKLNFDNKNIIPIKLDITQDKDCKKVIDGIIKKHGRLDVLVNVAGYSLAGPTLDFTSQDFTKILDTNVVGAFRLIKNAASYMKKNKFGRIINITSLSGLVALPNFGIYSASKFALEALGNSLHYELAKDNIWVTNVAPGAIKSNVENKVKMPHKTLREKIKLFDMLMPMVTKEEIAEKILEIINAKHPPASVTLGRDAQITYLLKKILPNFLWDKLESFVWQKK